MGSQDLDKELLEERYQKAVTEYKNKYADLEELGKEFSNLNGYKNSAKYYDFIQKELKYRKAVKAFKSESCDWEETAEEFKSLGEYKKSSEYLGLCLEKAEQLRIEEERRRREREEQERREREELEAKRREELYDSSVSLMQKGSFVSALHGFDELGDYKDSGEKAVECKAKLAEIKKARRQKLHTALLLSLVGVILALSIYLAVSLFSWKTDELRHWHSVLGIPVGRSGHSYVLVYEQLPTCEEYGKRTYQCEKCLHIHDEEIAPLGHSMDDGWITKAPTCTEDGLKTYYCRTCAAVLKTESIPATGHTADSVGYVTKKSTCTEEGVKTYFCTTCGAPALTEIIPAKGHTAAKEGVVTKEPTCTEEGVKSYFCLVCGEVAETEPVPAKGHVPGYGTVTLEPTCTEDGVRTFYCTVCGGIAKTQIIAATGHTYAEGSDACMNCGKVKGSDNVREWDVYLQEFKVKVSLNHNVVTFCYPSSIPKSEVAKMARTFYQTWSDYLDGSELSINSGTAVLSFPYEITEEDVAWGIILFQQTINFN